MKRLQESSTGGHDAGAATYDSGNVWITINGTQYSVSYGQGSSSSSVASALASAINAGSLASASANGATISLTTKTNGYGTNYSLSAGSSTSQPGSFSSPSFTASASGSTLTGGIDGIFYYVEDLLGTSRVLTTDTGVVCYDADFYPYGGERAYANTCPQNYKFEGKERDSETGNDDFGARYYSNRFGRWLSADWSSVPVAIPYANLSNPQTLNLYSMVADDPESFADLDGHACDHGNGVNGFPPDGPCMVEDEIGEGEARYSQRVKETTDQANAAKQPAYTTVPYAVHGTDASDAMKNANNSGASGCAGFAGCTNSNFSYTYDPEGKVQGTGDKSSATLTATNVNVTVSITVHLPNWVEYKDASPSEQKAWDAKIAKLTSHEEGTWRSIALPSTS